MPKFIVNVKEIHVQPIRVEAASKEDALLKAIDGDGDYLDIHNFDTCMETLDSETWEVVTEDDFVDR